MHKGKKETITSLDNENENKQEEKDVKSSIWDKDDKKHEGTDKYEMDKMRQRNKYAEDENNEGGWGR